MMTDPIADMLTRIRNALHIRADRVKIPKSKLKARIAEVLEREGYIKGCRQLESQPGDGIGPQGWLELDLKYGPYVSQGDRAEPRAQRVGYRDPLHLQGCPLRPRSASAQRGR